MTSSKTARLDWRESWVGWLAVIFIASLAVLVQSYLAIKLVFLMLFLFASVLHLIFRTERFVIYRRIVVFYLCIGIAGGLWALVGLVHNNSLQGVQEAVRLYVVWSLAFTILYTLLRNSSSLQLIHRALVLAGILIPLINFVGLYDQFNGLGLISDSVKLQLDMGIGFGDGYVQITSQNIDVMFLIAPYLLSLQFRSDARRPNSIFAKVALALSLLLVVLSGRRALWVVVALAPCTILLVSWLTSGFKLLKVSGKRILITCTIVSVLGLSVLSIFPTSGQDIGSISRLKQAFSSEDERTIQKPYLIDGYLESPVFGSGFGAAAAYVRDSERPWAGYELTYYQMLFNLGTVGMAVVGGIFLLYFSLVVRLLRQFRSGSAIPFGFLVAYVSLLIGAYSNRYFGSFDLLFFVGLLPYLSTFQSGFDQRELTGGVAV